MAKNFVDPNIPSHHLEQDAFQACRDVAGTFGIECSTRWSSVHQGGNMWAAYDCYLTAMRDVLGLRLPEHEAYAWWEQTTIEGGFRVVHPEFCIVCDFPETIKVDDQHRPHCSDGPSHRWRDGWALYHWHGVRIPEEWITKPETLTAAVALQTTNLELRRAACEMLGWNKVLSALGAKTIDDDGDPLIGCLVEVRLPGLQNGDEKVTARFLRVLCGTGREFAVCVDPACKTAIEAQAWMRGTTANKLFKMPEVRT